MKHIQRQKRTQGICHPSSCMTHCVGLFLYLHLALLQIYPHGSDEEADSPKADLPETPRERHQILPASLSQELNPRPHASAALHEGRVHSGAYPTSSQLLSEASLPRVEFPKLHAAVTSAPDWGEEHMEGQVRGGFPRVSSHPENLAGLAAVATMMESPFSRCALPALRLPDTGICLS